LIGYIAGFLTTICWVPQLIRSWRTRSLADVSWPYLCTLATGVALWTTYGIQQADPAIIVTNVATLACVLVLIGLKISSDRRGVRPIDEPQFHLAIIDSDLKRPEPPPGADTAPTPGSQDPPLTRRWRRRVSSRRAPW
jgi:MtN3 and saliva related transmembrane protein